MDWEYEQKKLQAEMNDLEKRTYFDDKNKQKA